MTIFILAASLVLLGVFMSSCLPKATAIHAELQRAGKMTADQARQKRKNIMAGGVAALVLGVLTALMGILKL